MLERVHDIPWRQYHDAYGPSKKTPALLQALASNDPQRRAGALDELSSTIYHQGSVYEATVHAVPFLLEMLAAPSYTGKAAVFEMLQLIAEGTSYHDVHQHLFIMREAAQTPQYQAKMRAEEGWVARVAEEVRKGVGLYVALLKDADPAVRISAAGMLVRVKDLDADALRRRALLESIESEADARVRAAAIAALASTAANDTDAPAVLRALFERERDPACRATLAILLVGTGHGQLDAEVIPLCREIACGRTDDVGEPNPILGPWAEAAVLALANRDDPPAEVLARMVEVFERGPADERHAVGLLLILLGERRGPWRGADLTPIQRRGIAAVARIAFPERATIYVNFTDVLKVFNLPQDRAEMEALLGVVLPGRHRPRATRACGKPWWKFWEASKP